jgi:arylsulfatase A-like enzyme
MMSLFLICAFALPVSPAGGQRPNVLVILADDLGFSDLGCYGGEIRTPHLDALAREGIRFTQFYNTGRCWPTRAALLTGYFAQRVGRDDLPAVEGLPTLKRSGKRPAWARLLPDRLKPLGYRTYHSGKWHLDGEPLENGFHRSYLLRDQGRFFNPQRHFEDGKKLPAVGHDSGYYATTSIVDHAIRCLQDHAKNHAGLPFFHYLAFTAPHFPLHALPEDIAVYSETYRDGWDVVRRARWERLQALGIVDGSLSAVEREVGPPYHFPEALKTLGSGEVNRPLPWTQLTQQQQVFQATKMALHAAMIDRVDREIGRVLAQLRAMDAFEDTLILFLSDNGASAEIMVRDDGHDSRAEPGSAATYICLGPGWSTVANTPMRRHKTWVHEGGIATPLIAHWPRGIRGQGELRRTPGHVIDLVPTVVELAGGEWPSTGDESPTPPGRSLVPLFKAEHAVTRSDLWWYHEGHRAIRRGDWKLVAACDAPWELFDLKNDRTETKDLAGKYPAKVRELEKAWKQRAAEFREQATR